MSFPMMGMYQKTCSPGLEEESVNLCRSCCVLPAGILHCIDNLLCDNNGLPLHRCGQYIEKSDKSIYICV